MPDGASGGIVEIAYKPPIEPRPINIMYYCYILYYIGS
jgi:hypothetical protein